MADLHACYFCGAAGETALNAYPVVPDPFAADTVAESPPTVVLCPSCKTKLDDVLATAFATAEADPDAESPEDPPWGSHAGVPGAVTPNDRAPSEEAHRSTTAPGGPSDGGMDTDDGDAADALSAAAKGEPDSAGPTESADDERAGDPSDGDERAGDPSDGDERAGDPPNDDERAGDPSDDGTADGAPASTTEDLPPVTPTTRKVVRLVQNRTFPLDRFELEEVARSAYELSPQEATDAVDAIVAHGVLEADGDQLRKP